MNTRISRILRLLAIGLVSANAVFAGLAASSDVTTTSFSSEDIKSLLIGKQRFWPDGSAVQIAYVGDSAVDAQIEELTGMNQGRYKNHWKRLVFTGKGIQPKIFDTVEELRSYTEGNNGVLAIMPGAPDGFPVTLSTGG